MNRDYQRLIEIKRKMQSDKVIERLVKARQDLYGQGYPTMADRALKLLHLHIFKFYPDFISIIKKYECV